MNRNLTSRISINRSRHRKIILILVSLFLFLIGPLTIAYADEYPKGLNGNGGYKGYYYGGNEFPSGGMGERGDGATGGLAAFLLVTANFTVLLSLTLKGITRLFPLNEETKKSILDFNRAQKRYLRGLHYYLNPIAICVAVVHFYLSNCASIIPDVALILFVAIASLGLILKFRLFPKDIYKTVYSLHCSWIIFLSTALLIMIGHATI